MKKTDKSKQRISVILVTRNEAAKVEGCLSSLGFANEIILFDNNSSDNTVELAKKFGVRLASTDSKNFSIRKNTAAKLAKFEWLLFMDADERVTPELKSEILSVINNSSNQDVVFAIPRKNIIFGKEFKYCGTRPDYVIRLFRRESFKGFVEELHEQPRFEGELRYLKNSLIHIKQKFISEMVNKTNEWSEIEAKLMFDAGHPPMNIVRFTTAGLREFYLRMIKQTAFLDGILGVIYAFYQVYSRLVSYSKLWEMQLNNK